MNEKYVMTSRGFSGKHFGGNIHRVYKLRVEKNKILSVTLVGHFWDTTKYPQKAVGIPSGTPLLQWGSIKYNFSNGKEFSLR